MKHLIYSIVLLTFISCSNCGNQPQSIAPMSSEMIPFISDSISVDGDLEDFEVKISSENLEEGLDIVKVSLTSKKAATPPKITLRWQIPSIDIAKFWNPNLGVDKATYYSNNVKTSATRYAPVLCYMNMNDENRFTVAIGDALNKLELGSYLKEEDANFHYYLVLFDEEYPAIKHYETQILVDRRNKNFAKTLTGVTDWWAKQENYQPAETPQEALRPMYSTWYSYHQTLDVNELLEECRESKKMGMEAIIVDDGWQTMDDKRGYAFTGDWKPDRIPDMKGFVDQVHELDMKFLLWYSVPFIGKNAENYPHFKGQYLYYWDSQGAWVLDPRYPEVREFIIGIYEDAMADWGLDGFKLDFMAFFKPGEETELTAEDGRDYASVYHAVDRLMTDIMGRLKEKNPEILIEFRQPYIGPLMRKYGNMLRAADCPNMATINRVRTTDTRLLGGSSAIHADMLMWHPNDEVEHAALQILNIMFSVPQISVRLNEIPQEHKDMIAFWVKYWNENQEVLMKGDFTPQKPDELYPILKAQNTQKAVIGLYGNDMVETDGFKDLEAFDIINARNKTQLVLLNTEDLGLYYLEVRDCMGMVISERKIKLNKGAIAIDVPASGLVKLRK